MPYAAIQFTTMQQFNSLARDLKLEDHRAAPLVPYVSGAVAGAAATFVSYPFDLLRTTLAAQGEPKVLIQPLAHSTSGRVLRSPLAGNWTELSSSVIHVPHISPSSSTSGMVLQTRELVRVLENLKSRLLLLHCQGVVV